MEVWCDLVEKFLESGGLPWISTKACEKWVDVWCGWAGKCVVSGGLMWLSGKVGVVSGGLMWQSGKIEVLSKYWFVAAGRNLLEPRFKRLQSSKSPNSPGAVQNNCRNEQQFVCFFSVMKRKRNYFYCHHILKRQKVFYLRTFQSSFHPCFFNKITVN